MLSLSGLYYCVLCDTAELNEFLDNYGLSLSENTDERSLPRIPININLKVLVVKTLCQSLQITPPHC